MITVAAVVAGVIARVVAGGDAVAATRWAAARHDDGDVGAWGRLLLIPVLSFSSWFDDEEVLNYIGKK